MPLNDATSRFIGFGDKSWDNFKNHFQTQSIEFLFLSQGARRAAFGGSISPKNARFETQPPLSLQTTSFNRVGVDAGGLRAVHKTAGHRLASNSPASEAFVVKRLVNMSTAMIDPPNR